MHSAKKDRNFEESKPFAGEALAAAAVAAAPVDADALAVDAALVPVVADAPTWPAAVDAAAAARAAVAAIEPISAAPIVVAAVARVKAVAAAAKAPIAFHDAAVQVAVVVERLLAAAARKRHLEEEKPKKKETVVVVVVAAAAAAAAVEAVEAALQTHPNFFSLPTIWKARQSAARPSSHTHPCLCEKSDVQHSTTKEQEQRQAIPLEYLRTKRHHLHACSAWPCELFALARAGPFAADCCLLSDAGVLHPWRQTHELPCSWSHSFDAHEHDPEDVPEIKVM